MKKLCALILCVATIVACQDKKKDVVPASQIAAQRDSLQQIIDSKDREINDMMGTLNEIQEGFRLISAAGERSLLSRMASQLIRRNRYVRTFAPYRRLCSTTVNS